MREEERDRMEAFRQGDECIFRYYYEKYYHALCQSVLRIIREEVPMHDIVQEAFIILWNSRTTIESELHLKMFLYQVARNQSFNYLKSLRIKDKYVNEYLTSDEAEDIEDSVVEEEVYRLVIREIENLPDEQKKVVYLHLEGENNLTIAEILKISVNTVKTHKARAKKTLKSRLNYFFVLYVFLGF